VLALNQQGLNKLFRVLTSGVNGIPYELLKAVLSCGNHRFGGTVTPFDDRLSRGPEIDRSAEGVK
jgi:hypothetical protein